MSAQPCYGADSHVLRLAKVLRHLLDRETFTSMADLKDAYASLLAGYHLAYEAWDLDAAFTLVGSNRPLTMREAPPRRPPIPAPPSPIGAVESAGLLARHGLAPKAFPGASARSSHEAQVRAQAEQWRGRGDDPADEQRREQRAAAAERIAWERQILERQKTVTPND